MENLNLLANEDKLIFRLSSLFELHGYKKFFMSKFEEYSFYSDYRDFLSSQGIIAFNDGDGRLMALKPDVTLSIVKNSKLESNRYTKVYYTENVYRLSPDSHNYREIRQMGAELLGEVDNYSTEEVLILALKALDIIDKSNYLCISHMAFIADALKLLDIPSDIKQKIIICEKSKNAHDLTRICEASGVSDELKDYFVALTGLSGDFLSSLAYIKSIAPCKSIASACDELEIIYNSLDSLGFSDRIKLETSIFNHTSYYNGIVFSGFLKNAPSYVLSGGRYDKLASKIRGSVSALGFAIYIDNLSLYYPSKKKYDFDVLIINPTESGDYIIHSSVERFAAKGKTVRVESSDSSGFTAAEKYLFDGKELREVKDA